MSNKSERSKSANDDTSVDPKAPQSLEDFLPFQLAVVANVVSQSIASIIEKKYNLHIPEWRILVALANHAPCSPYEIADYTAMDRARVSRAQQRLSDLALISQETSPDDGRKLLISLTNEGENVVAEMLPDAHLRGEWIFEGLSKSERSLFTAALSKLFDRAKALED